MSRRKSKIKRGRRFLGRPKVEGVAEYLIGKGVPPERVVTSTSCAERLR
jgi:hypothetical protein